MKKIIFLLLVVALMWPNVGTHAAYNDFVANGDVTINISNLSIDLIMKSGANLETYTVNAGNIEVGMSTTSTLTLESADKRSFTVTPSQNWETYNFYCGSDLSNITLKLPAGTAATTLTITPSATTCSSGGGGSSLGSGSSCGGGGSAAVSNTPAVENVPTLPTQAQARVRGVPFILAGLADGTLVKGSLPAVYYYHGGRRFVFVNDKAYKTWYPDFKNIKTISATDLSSVPLGGNITYKPGFKMIKINTDPKVYAVAKGGVLRWIQTEALAVALYGATWNKQIDDVSDAFFTNYTVGDDIDEVADFNPSEQRSSTANIATDFGL